jgi:alpha-tubulin suppressor-like RCC1 family protein
VKQISPFHLEKATFFARPFEFQLLVDDSLVYEPFWSRQFESLNKELVCKEEQIIDLAVGSCHSFAITSKGRAFAWGWNDRRQCGNDYSPERPHQVKSGFSEKEKSLKFVQVTCGNDHSLLLTSSGAVLALGDNSKGQLGLGHYSEQKTPAFLDLPPCKQVEAVGNQNMAVSCDGLLFIWPFETFHGEKRSYPVQMLPEHLVAEVAVGFNFAVVLTTAGVLFSLGSNNRAGQLGLGDLIPRHAPTLVLSLKKSGDKIAAVSCGHQHVVARSTLGKVFTWGNGNDGQLGHGGVENELLPRVVLFGGKNEKIKPLQISAGFSFSIIMTENRRIFWTGKSTMLNSTVFQELNLSSRLPELFKSPGEFAVVKIKSIWSKLLSIGMIIIADLRYLQNVPQNKLNTGLNLLASRWTGKGSDGIEGMFLRCINR